jgi:hypothetical protein
MTRSEYERMLLIFDKALAGDFSEIKALGMRLTDDRIRDRFLVLIDDAEAGDINSLASIAITRAEIVNAMNDDSSLFDVLEKKRQGVDKIEYETDFVDFTDWGKQDPTLN